MVRELGKISGWRRHLSSVSKTGRKAKESLGPGLAVTSVCGASGWKGCEGSFWSDGLIRQLGWSQIGDPLVTGYCTHLSNFIKWYT